VDAGCKFWDLRDLGLDHFKLALSFFELKINHSDLLFFRANSLFTLLQAVLLNVTLFIVDAQFVISIDKLDTHIVSALTSHLIFVNKIIHLLLQRVDNKVEFIAFIDFLTYD
jgi:hypothetical protein